MQILILDNEFNDNKEQQNILPSAFSFLKYLNINAQSFEGFIREMINLQNIQHSCYTPINPNWPENNLDLNDSGPIYVDAQNL